MEKEEKLKLNEAFALAIGWKRRGRKWIDPLGGEQLLPPPYFQNDALAWGGMARDKSLGYRVEYFPATADYLVVAQKGDQVAYFKHESLATAICAAVAMVHGRWQPALAANAAEEGARDE
jgi:hypothetical protein